MPPRAGTHSRSDRVVVMSASSGVFQRGSIMRFGPLSRSFPVMYCEYDQKRLFPFVNDGAGKADRGLAFDGGERT